MRKIVAKSVMALATVMALGSCAIIGTPVGAALAYTDVSHTEAVTSNPIGTKVGTAKATNILGLIAMGDASVQVAANSAGIRKVSHVDVKRTNILGLFSTYTIYVYGE